MDSLLAAYRVGARVAWRGLAQAAEEAGRSATTMAKFAELLFAYIDELSAASVAGHSDELTNSGRARDRYREVLAEMREKGLVYPCYMSVAELDALLQCQEVAPPTAIHHELTIGHGSGRELRSHGRHDLGEVGGQLLVLA